MDGTAGRLAPMDRRDLIERLRSAIEECLSCCIPPETSDVAIVGFPNHSNVGDSAIWAGQIAYCSFRGFRIVDVCDRRTYSRGRLAKRLGPHGIILFAGGGNFGDLFRGDHALRERVIEDFPNHRIIQLPQTIHFKSTGSLDQSKRIINAHRQVTLLVRDTRSLAFARQHFDADVVLCPDMAFYLGRLPRPAAASIEQLWLWRKDIEAPQEAANAYGRPAVGIQIVDWPKGTSMLHRANKRLTRAILRHPTRSEWLKSLSTRMFNALARTRFQAGCRLLAQGSVVVTNRLHAHILCLLMGLPHVVMDNNYGKISGFGDTWITFSESARFCTSVAEAREAARVLARRVRSGAAQDA